MWCLNKTVATLQLKNTNSVVAYIPRLEKVIDFILDCDNFVTNAMNHEKDILFVTGQKRLKIKLFYWLRFVKYLDNSIHQEYREIQKRVFFCWQNRKEQIFNHEELLPGLPLFKTPEKMVYLIGNRRDNLIKIGISQDVRQRLRALQTTHKTPLEILATKQGSFDTEKELHRKFSQFRRHGEWFTWDDSIIANFD